eukprot:6720182-Heterocapsa_arctica.AAC.1
MPTRSTSTRTTAAAAAAVGAPPARATRRTKTTSPLVGLLTSDRLRAFSLPWRIPGARVFTALSGTGQH